MTEYNLSNPSVAEEERMIQDKIDEEYAMRKAEEKAYWGSLENAHWGILEREYWDSLEIKEK